MAELVREPLPVFWVVGTHDPLMRLGRSYAYDKLPRGPRSDFREVEAEHQGVPRAAAVAVAEWLRDVALSGQK